MKKRFALGLLAVAAFPVIVMAADDHHATVQPEALKWAQPAAYAKGAQLAVVKGDPTKEGMYVVRLKVPAGYKVKTQQ